MSGVKVKGGSTSSSLHALTLQIRLIYFLAALLDVCTLQFFVEEKAASWLPSPSSSLRSPPPSPPRPPPRRTWRPRCSAAASSLGTARGKRRFCPHSRPQPQPRTECHTLGLRSVFRAPLRDARLPLRRSQLLRLLARRGLDARDPRPHVASGKCSRILPYATGTCPTRHRKWCVHRARLPEDLLSD